MSASLPRQVGIFAARCACFFSARVDLRTSHVATNRQVSHFGAIGRSDKWGGPPRGWRAPDWGRGLQGPSGQLVPPSRQTESQLGSGFRSVCGGVIVMMMSICAGINNRGSPKLCLQLYTTRATSLIDVASRSQTLVCCNQCFLLSPLPLTTVQQLSPALPRLLQLGLLLLFKHSRIIPYRPHAQCCDKDLERLVLSFLSLKKASFVPEY